DCCQLGYQQSFGNRKGPTKCPHADRFRGKDEDKEDEDKLLNFESHHWLPPLLMVLLSNVQFIRNKIDELEVWTKFKGVIKELCRWDSWDLGSKKMKISSIVGFTAHFNWTNHRRSLARATEDE
ncbi:hypothetical protein XENOCAPTIV_024012, partial [Xenoophorus captivus]